MIVKTLVVGPFASNCFIVGSEKTKEGMIIDPGADAKKILNTVHDLGLSIVMIVATHNHIDHVGALRPVKDATGAKYAVHEADSKEAMPAMFGRMMGLMLGSSLKAPPKPDMLLRDGDVIEVGELKFQVIHTPGHSPGGISLLGDGVVFSGDTLFNLGIGRTDIPGGDYAKLMDSIITKLMVLPDSTVVYPGHGPETTIGTERKWNPFLR
jgi:glyoxylase-like metal-dependent hydrolase (beta-lactamase superfamily II)